MINEPEVKHLTFGGSSAHRWLGCPGSAKLCATLPPQVENEHMKEGTRAHALLELAMRERRDSVLDLVGHKLQAEWPEVDTDMAEAVQVAVNHVNEILDKHPDAVFWAERMFRLKADVGGTADVVIYIPSLKLLKVIDYKHGRGKYVSERTPQMKLYAACVLFSMEDYLVERIDATIVQPRCQVGEPIRTAVYGPSDLIAFSDEVDAAVALAKSDNPPLIAGEEQCHWCPAAHVCPALHTKLPEVAAAAWDAPGEEDVVVTLASPASMRNNVDKFAATLAVLPLVQAWIDAIEDQATALAMAGYELPGFKLVSKQARRKFSDKDATLKWFAENTLLDEDEFAPRELLSVAQAEKLVKQIAGKDGVKAMAEFVVKESSGLKLVPSDAKGEAVSPLAVAGASFVSAVTI